jgi:hypothetical protein
MIIRNKFARRFRYALAVAVLVGLPLVFLSRKARAAQDNQQSQQTQQQGQQAQDQSQQQKPKKKSGFFSGLKEVTGSSSEQTSATASAGAKGIGDGEKIGNVTPTAADRKAVTAMDNYSVPQGDLSKFIQDGHLNSKQ